MLRFHKKIHAILTLLLSGLVLISVSTSLQAVTEITITDKEINSCIRDKFELGEGQMPSQKQLRRIQYLNCNDRSNFAEVNLRELAQLPKLKSLNLSRTQLKDLSGLRELRGLRTLFLEGNNLKDQDIQVLANMPEIKTLILANNRLERVDVFAGLDNLHELDLAGNLLQEASQLESLPELLWLDLSKNCIGKLPSFDFIDAFMDGQVKPGNCKTVTSM